MPVGADYRETDMKKGGSSDGRPVYSNKLLNRLSDVDHGLIAPHLTLVKLEQGTIVATPDNPIERLIFLETGIASVTLKSRQRDYEISMIGNEGVLNGVLAMGESMHVFKTAIATRGKGYVIEADQFLKAAALSPSLTGVLTRFQHVEAVQRATSAAAVSGYQLPQRVARWVLMTDDRLVGSHHVVITHEQLGNRLAVRRPGITVVMQELEGEGSIRNDRASIHVLDRQKLIMEAGGSYGVAEAAYKRLLGA